MSFDRQVLVLMVIGSLGLWGCAQGPSAAHAERIRALETKIAKLEEDFKAAVAGREQLRRKLTTAEEEKTQLSQQVEQLLLVVKERDELRQQLAVRTAERDTIQTQFVHFRKSIRNLLGQAETASNGNAPAQPVTSVAEAPSPGKS
jgi:septal ring factor EnvC (AmiA/AmiB activator)